MRDKKTPAIISLNFSHSLWGWVKEQQVTREKKKGSGTYYWKERASFSGLLIGHQTLDCMTALWSSKLLSLSPLSLSCLHVFSLERWDILAGFRHETLVASMFWSYHISPHPLLYPTMSLYLINYITLSVCHASHRPTIKNKHQLYMYQFLFLSHALMART